MTNYTILLPPSEGKNLGGEETKPYRVTQNNKKENFFKSLSSEREFLYDELKLFISNAHEEELEKLFELKSQNLKEAYEATFDLLNEETMTAIERYDGVMFKAINFKEMYQKQQENFNKSIVFIDGLFGLLKPQDKIPYYKLKIASKFGEIDITKFWKERLAGYFEMISKNKLLIDILPEAHRKILTIASNVKYYQVMFMEEKNGILKQAGHTSKQLKGELINYICQKESISRDYLEEFSHSSGYAYSKELSKEQKIVYLKE